MEDRTSTCPRPNWMELLEALQFQSIITYADECQQNIFLDWTEKDEKSLMAVLRYESAALGEVSDYLQTNDEAQYAFLRLGSLLGTVESLDRMLFEQAQDQWAQTKFQEQTMRVKHLPEIVMALETHGSMTHTDLSQYLSINPPTLTEAMKKVLETGAVQATSVGKYKVYTLTDSGLRYGRELRKKGRAANPVDDALQTLRQYVKNSNDAPELEAFWNEIIAVLDERPDGEIHLGDALTLPCYSFPTSENTVQTDFNNYMITSTCTAALNCPADSFAAVFFSKKRTPRSLCFGGGKPITQKRRMSKWQIAGSQKSMK